ncbi:MAG: hypothetical protein R2788_21050 [Saprospiraceae bacterium]
MKSKHFLPTTPPADFQLPGLRPNGQRRHRYHHAGCLGGAGYRGK